MVKKIIVTGIFYCWISFLPDVALAQASEEKEVALQASELTNAIIQYRADKGSLDRFYYLKTSPERISRISDLDKQNLKRLEQYNYSRLSNEGKVDYTLFKRNLTNDLRILELDRQRSSAAKSYLPFADDVYAFEKQRRRGATIQAGQYAAKMNEWTSATRELIKKLDSDKNLDLSGALAAEQLAADVREALKNIHEFYNGYDPQYTYWMDASYKGVDSLLKVYAMQLPVQGRKNSASADDGSGIIGKPIGRDELISQLSQEFIPYTPEELVAIAEKEFAWCDKELLKATGEMGYGTDWKKAMEKVKNTYVPEGKQPEMILDLYNQSIDFIKKKDLISIPPIAEETWRMIMMTPQRQLVNPFFTGGEVISISYPTNTMVHSDKMMSMRGNNPHFSRATVHHELIAGHHLQGFMNQRYRNYRNFNTPFWVEGWALYWELILWDLGFPRGPEDKIGMLFWRMHRCARIIFSLNYHLGKWTPQQCIDFLVDRVGHERANAEGEVRRSFVGGYSPLYQVAYMIGGLQFYALKKELVDKGKLTYKQYHDAVLQENQLPVEMIRALLINKPPAKDFTSTWRFYPLDHQASNP
jgi:uncharacterized protein (DUF885 family)